MNGKLAAAALCALVLGAAAARAQDQYEIGGPLAGIKLPLWPTQNGDRPGYPGNFDGRTQGLAPELLLYPGSVEHWHGYWFKYCPVRSFFDQQSLLKNFIAKDVPGIEPRYVGDYAAPVYHCAKNGPATNTGKKLAPVSVVRCAAAGPAFKLDLGELPAGLYAVRVIGAVETKNLRPFLLPLYLRFKVNDGLAGEVGEYRQRIPYNDEFYSVAEFYFHAPARRNYRAELSVDQSSQTELLVHNLTLDDALAGTEFKGLKPRASLLKPAPDAAYSEAAIGKRAPLSAEARWKRDSAIWNAFPALNKSGTLPDDASHMGLSFAKIEEGADGKPLAQVEAQYGKWDYKPMGSWAGGGEARIHVFARSLDNIGQLVTNDKMKLAYTLDDLAANRALPDPYPYKDDGAGLFYPSAANPADGLAFMPVSFAVCDRIYEYVENTASGGRFFQAGCPNPDYARDSAVALCRFAYDFPTLDVNRYMQFIVKDPGLYSRPLLRMRETSAASYGNYIRYLNPVESYDRLFGYIQGNEDLARSVNRFVPWVKTSDDVLKLLDTYLVQTMAKRVLRYQYYGDGREPARIAQLATVVSNNAATDPWMDWLFARCFFYPNPIAGIQDLMITGTDRDGRSPIGSYFYMLGEFSADQVAEQIEDYIANGGNPKYDLRDPRRYPKSRVSLDFYALSRTAGNYFPRIGDVTGPDKVYGAWFDNVVAPADRGWRWTKDPKFAFILKNYSSQGARTDAEWAEIAQAAAKVPRAPWLENRSRVLSGWAAFLESGVEHDDFRFRRSTLVRLGSGMGHEHDDALDLQVYAHGLPMTIDGGQRSGYTKPTDRHTRVHNTVEVDGQDWDGYSWARALSDAPGARYLDVQGAPPGEARLFRRQAALIDVAEGSGSQPLTPAQCGDRTDGLPKGVVTPDSYTFDCFRVAGGQAHSYCFHAMVNDEFAWNVPDAKPAGQMDQADADYLGLFPDDGPKLAGSAPEKLEATWRQTRNGPGSEQAMLGGAYDANSPRKFTRLHLFGGAGARALRAQSVCSQWGYQLTCLMLRRTSPGAQSVFPAIIEPYVGEPFIKSAQLMDIMDNEMDSQRAVAVQVRTVNGHTDLCFADGRPDKERQVGGIKVAAEFAYYSTDEGGLRQASLTGGTLIETPEVTMKAAQRERAGKILRADYLEKSVILDAPWPPLPGPKVIEVGALGRPDGYIAGYTAVAVQSAEGGTKMTFREGADYFRSEIQTLDPAANAVQCTLAFPSAYNLRGRSKGFAASDEDMTRFWRADMDGSPQRFKLTPTGDAAQKPLSMADFGRSRSLRLWEYGVGDTVRQSTSVSLRRLEARLFELVADVDVTISLAGAAVEISTDRAQWRPLSAQQAGGKLQFSLPASPGPVYLRVK